MFLLFTFVFMLGAIVGGMLASFDLLNELEKTKDRREAGGEPQGGSKAT